MRGATAMIVCLLLTAPIFARETDKIEGVTDIVPQLVLLSPRPEDVDLTGKETLEFKWSPHEGVSGFREYYDFRLYKGHSMVETALIFKEKLSSRTYQYNINSDKFQDDEVYTWALRQAYSDGHKSAWSHVSFKVIKK